MVKKINSFTKKEIIKDIQSKTGLPNFYINKILEDLLLELKILIKKNNAQFKNFGSFKLRKKKERVGRNPKTKQAYIIQARKSASFYMSKQFKDKINK